MGISQFIGNRVEKSNISCKTFLVTVFGDVISQHGQWVWLGSLIEVLSNLGYSERLVRTSVFRLVKDDWLQVKKVGRKSYYSLTENANNHYTKAARRIYSATRKHDDDRWLIVIPSFVDETQLVQFKRQLKWLGFSSLASGVYAHPFADRSSLNATLKELNLQNSVVVLSAKITDKNSLAVLKKQVHEKWNLNWLDDQYSQFFNTYQKQYDLIKKEKNKISSEQSFLVRLLLIHEYRRILLKDNELSSSMLPIDWSGYKAHSLSKDLYALLSKQSQSYIVNSLKNIDGCLPKASAEFNDRFRH